MANLVKQPCDEDVVRSKEAVSSCAANAAPWILAATILGSSMSFNDETALPVALPAIVMIWAPARARAQRKEYRSMKPGWWWIRRGTLVGGTFPNPGR